MLKDLETTSRHEEHLKKIKKKWMDESKKYKEILLTALKKNQQSKMKERQKAIELMMEKEKKSRENVQNFLQQQEKERQKLEIDTHGKSTYIFL